MISSKQKKGLFIVIALSVSFFIRAQSPGGISTGLNLWLDASNGAAVSGSNLTGWSDKAATNAFTVSATPPTVTTNAINFHSTVNFNNSTSTDVYPAEQSLIGDTPINYTDAYAVFKVNDGNGGVIVGGTIPGTSYGKAVFAEFNSAMHSGNGDPTTYSSFPFTDFGNYHVFGMDTNLAGNMVGRLDGADQNVTDLAGFSSINFIPAIGTTNNNGNLAGWNHLNGQIAELIIYDQTTAGQRINIESYLALKYGIHKAGNYVSSTNTVIWDASANVAFHNDVFGIGQDDTSGLNQNISNSMNTGSGDGTGQNGKGNIILSNPSSLANANFLLIGNDANDFSFVTTNLPVGSPTGFVRMNRTWKTQTTGSVGTVSLQFDITALSIPGTLNDLKLLIDADGDGNLATGSITTVSSGSISGNTVLFDNVNFPAGSTFTFAAITVAAPAVSPGGVVNAVIWYKANAGITLNVNNVSQWNDFSGNVNNAIQGTSANQPSYTANSVNYNQTVTFSGTNYLTAPVSNLPSGNSARSIFIVATSSSQQVSTGWVFGYGINTPGQCFNIGRRGITTNLYISGNAVDSQSSAGFWQASIAKLGTITYNSSLVSFFDAGASLGTATQTGWSTTLAANSGRIGAFGNTTGEFWRGNIAEIIVYPSVITGNNAMSIESYLSIKYGIHKTGSYLDSTGAIIWDATTNAAYHNDVFGIGEDDISGLTQSISNNMNTGSGNGTGQSGKGNIVVSNPSSLVNNGFLMIGHNTNALTESLVITGTNITKRIQRIWKVQTTGNPGTVSLSYDITGLVYSGQNTSDYVLLVDPTGTGNFGGGSVVQYTAAAITANKVSFNTVDLPTGAVFTFQTISVPIPTIQATNVVYTNTGVTTTTVSWTNGNGSSRAVFMHQGASGSPTPDQAATYTANTVFGTGTQIGTSGWYCVYNGTGTTVNVTGLTPATTYQVMTVEYNGSPGNEAYLSTTSTGNPATVTTLNNIATLSNLNISEGTLAPVFASATTSYTATVPYATANLTVTPTTTDSNATVTVNGTAVISGNASGAIVLAVGPNVITTVVTAQDGTTIETYTVTVTRTEPTIITTGTLSALTTIYGTPSTSTTFDVSGTDMSEGILITAPTAFEVSIDDITFTDTVIIGAAGIISSTPVYIRLKGTISAGSYSGNVVLISSNAATVNVITALSTVTPAALTITADNQTKVYGTANPALTASYTGFVNGDTEASLTTAPTITTTAVDGSPVGSYPITASGAVNANYTISYVDGNLSVTTATLTITADNKTKVYGDANPALTASYSGFVNGDTEASLTTAPTISTTAVNGSLVGSYPITASGAVNTNYTISYVAGNLSVTTATLTITADDQSKTYGAANPTLTASYSGFVNGDTATSLTTAPTITTTAVTGSPVGSYPITASGAVSPNYAISYVDGSLTVTTATLTITADDQSKTYGAANPTLTASYSGFVNGDTAASLTTPPTISTTAVDGSPVGSYPITASGAVNTNYTISYVAGNLTVTTATLTITKFERNHGDFNHYS